MKFKTKLWKRSQKSFGTTIPYVALLTLDENKKYDVIWEFNPKLNKWTVSFDERKKVKNDK